MCLRQAWTLDKLFTSRCCNLGQVARMTRASLLFSTFDMTQMIGARGTHSRGMHSLRLSF